MRPDPLDSRPLGRARPPESTGVAGNVGAIALGVCVCASGEGACGEGAFGADDTLDSPRTDAASGTSVAGDGSSSKIAR